MVLAPYHRLARVMQQICRTGSCFLVKPHGICARCGQEGRLLGNFPTPCDEVPIFGPTGEAQAKDIHDGKKTYVRNDSLLPEWDDAIHEPEEEEQALSTEETIPENPVPICGAGGGSPNTWVASMTTRMTGADDITTCDAPEQSVWGAKSSEAVSKYMEPPLLLGSGASRDVAGISRAKQ